jgi:hypothetical protein
VPEDEGSSESCLHCEINDLVREHMEQSETVNLADVAGKITESLAEVILLAPKKEQGNMLADVTKNLGHAFLEKSGAIEDGQDTTH